MLVLLGSSQSNVLCSHLQLPKFHTLLRVSASPLSFCLLNQQPS